MEKKFYSCEEIAELMGIKISTIRTYCKEGKIPSIKIGRSYYISAKDFDEWCEEMKLVPRDIEIKRYIKKLKDSDAKHKNLIDQSLDGIVMTDFKSTLVLVNPSFCKMLDYGEEELLGTNFTQYVHPDERAQTVEDHMRRIAGEVSHEPKIARLLKRDGKTVIAEILESPTWESGKIVGVQKIVRDITARKRLEQELEIILNLLPDAFAFTDFKGKIFRAGSRVEELTGYTKEELFSMESIVNLYWYSEERQKALTLLKEKGEFHDFEFTARLKGDIQMPSEMSAKIIEIDGEKYIASLVRDVTERKRLQDDLQKTKDLLEATLNTLNFGISHLDANLRVIFTNAWLKKKVPDITVGETCHMPFGEGKELCPWCPSAKCVQSGKPEKAEATLKRADGTLLKFYLQAYPIKDDKGSVKHVVETFAHL
jgi:PAS domain S-box-containing protein/excisionase family DNA binding protein